MRATFEAALDALPTLATVVLVAVGAWRIHEGAINTGDLVGFVALFALLSWPMRFIGWILAELPRAVVGYDRLQTVFAEQVTVAPPAHPEPLPDGPLGLSVSDVRPDLRRTAGPGRRELRRVEPGESVAIVGPTGVGKSTLVAAARASGGPGRGRRERRRHRRPQDRPAGAPQAASIVFQESFLFAASVRENIALDDTVDGDEVVRSAMIASADRFIRELPNGYDTVVGERGHTAVGRTAPAGRAGDGRSRARRAS